MKMPKTKICPICRNNLLNKGMDYNCTRCHILYKANHDISVTAHTPKYIQDSIYSYVRLQDSEKQYAMSPVPLFHKNFRQETLILTDLNDFIEQPSTVLWIVYAQGIISTGLRDIFMCGIKQQVSKLPIVNIKKVNVSQFLYRWFVSVNADITADEQFITNAYFAPTLESLYTALFRQNDYTDTMSDSDTLFAFVISRIQKRYEWCSNTTVLLYSMKNYLRHTIKRFCDGECVQVSSHDFLKPLYLEYCKSIPELAINADDGEPFLNFVSTNEKLPMFDDEDLKHPDKLSSLNILFSIMSRHTTRVLHMVTSITYTRKLKELNSLTKSQSSKLQNVRSWWKQVYKDTFYTRAICPICHMKRLIATEDTDDALRCEGCKIIITPGLLRVDKETAYNGNLALCQYLKDSNVYALVANSVSDAYSLLQSKFNDMELTTILEHFTIIPNSSKLSPVYAQSLVYCKGVAKDNITANVVRAKLSKDVELVNLRNELPEIYLYKLYNLCNSDSFTLEEESVLKDIEKQYIPIIDDKYSGDHTGFISQYLLYYISKV